MKKAANKQWLYLILGFTCLVLAYFGIVMPGFPATPFIVLTGYFFMRSSDRMYNWIMRQRIFAKIIGSNGDKQIFTPRVRWFTASQIAIAAAVSSIFFAETIRTVLLISGGGLLACILVIFLRSR